MARVLALLWHYPALSQTYQETELRHLLARGHEVRVAAVGKPDPEAPTHQPYVEVPRDDPRALEPLIAEFAPTVVHGHYMDQVPALFKAASRAGVPFTVRAHSADILGRRRRPYLPLWASLVNMGQCLGVLTFPFTRPLLEAAGVRSDKIVDCWPVVDYARFHDESPNGDDVLNVGACLPKKKHESFLEVAAADRSGRAFNLYPLGDKVQEVIARNQALGSPVTIHEPVAHEMMPAVYKQHGWLVYTSCPELKAIGWPMAVAEAQAAGVLVAIQDVRPDLRTYVGPGYFFDSVEEAVRIIAQAPPDELRQAGFDHAKKSDIADHIGLLEELWAAA